MTNQEAYDTAIIGLLKQGRKSVEPGAEKHPFPVCRYRGSDGCKCGIGQVIPDEFYSPEFEGRGVLFLVSDGKLPNLRGVNRGLLFDIQYLHDRVVPSEWVVGARDMALNYGLSTAAMDAHLATQEAPQ